MTDEDQTTPVGQARVRHQLVADLASVVFGAREPAHPDVGDAETERRNVGVDLVLDIRPVLDTGPAVSGHTHEVQLRPGGTEVDRSAGGRWLVRESDQCLFTRPVVGELRPVIGVDGAEDLAEAGTLVFDPGLPGRREDERGDVGRVLDQWFGRAGSQRRGGEHPHHPRDCGPGALPRIAHSAVLAHARSLAQSPSRGILQVSLEERRAHAGHADLGYPLRP